MADADYAIVIDDDPSVQAILGRAIGMAVVPFHTMDGFLNQMDRYSPKAVFLDIMLAPDSNGLDAVPKAKALWPYVPVLVMTSSLSEHWIVEALGAGADDFLAKPLNVAEVKARLNVRSHVLDSLRKVEILDVGNLRFSPRHGWLDVAEKKAFLSPVAAVLMKAFFENVGVVVSRETLHRLGWPSVKVSENALDQRILEIRRSLSELGSEFLVHCVHGEGYFFSRTKPARGKVRGLRVA